MANIPQPVPGGEPKSFLSYSKPIEQPKSMPAPSTVVDTSLGTLFKDIGQMFTNVTTAGDTIIKDVAREGLQKDIDKQRGDFTSELSQFSKDAGASGQSGTPSLSNPGGSGEDDTADMPDEVTSIGDQVSNLSTARGAGKISPTQYWGAIDNIAKEYRSRYPGHRDFIDKTISSITGHNPANAYMSSIMSDLNTALRGNTKVDPQVKIAQDNFKDLVKQGAIPQNEDFNKLWEMTQRDPNKFNSWANSVNAPEWKYKTSNWETGTDSNNLKTNARTARVVASDYANGTAWAGVESSLIIGGETLESVQKKLYEMSSDPKKADPKQAEVLGLQFVMLNEQSKVGLRSWLMNTKNASGTTIAQAMAGENGDVEKTVNDFIKERYTRHDSMVKNITSNNPNIAALQAGWLKGQATNDQFNVLTSADDFTKHLRILEILKPYPKEAQDYFKTMLQGQYEGNNINVTNWARNMFGMFMTGRSQGQLVSVDDAIKKAQAAGVTDPKLYSDFAKFGEKIMSPDLSQERKVDIAASMFNPKNFGFLSNFKEDKVIEDVNGVYRMAPGKYSVWQTYTSPAFASEIKRISEKNPEVGVWYKNWVQQGFGSDIFGPQVRDLSKMASDPRATFTYNNVTNTFNKIEQDTGDVWSALGARTQRRAGVTDQMNSTITLMNEGLRGLANEAATRGITDPAAVQGYLLSQLKGLGFIPPEAKVRPDPKTVGEQLVNAFIAGAKQLSQSFSPVAGKEKKK